MDLTFYPLTLEAIDQAAAESLCLFIASDERPLTGLAGLADWRLSGKLSRLLRSGLLTGDAGEAVLTPPGTRLAFQKLFLFGVGPSGQSDEKLNERVAEALRKLAQAGVQEAAMQLPARMSVEVGIRALIDELQGPGRAMVFGADPQKLVAALSQAATRGSAQIERRVVKVPPPPSPGPLKPRTGEFSPVNPPRPRTGEFAAVPPAIPKASPLPFAPEPAIPKASPLPAAPSEPPVPVAPAVPSEPPPAAAAPGSQPPEERKPAPPPPQKYVPPPAKPHVFESKRRKK